MTTHQRPEDQIVRTRFAPSPSGHLHVGGARSALFCWAFAKAHEGRFILRIEDTDQKRSSDLAGLAFLEDLCWLGLHWDEGPEFKDAGGGAFGPYEQSKRLGLYNRFLEQLIDDGHAYRAFETPEELTEARALARKEGRTYRYDRAALALDDAAVEQYLDEGRPHVVRFKTPEGSVTVHDQVVGDVEVDNAQLDDFVLRKADGYPTYHFAVVVDDELMGVTHVLRAQEHLYNTPRHILLQRALGFFTPVYAHMSIITNPDGSKMSKRDKDKALRKAVIERELEGPPDGTIDTDRWTWWMASKDHQLALDEAARLANALDIHLPEINVDDFRRSGYLPEVLLKYLMLLGWSPGEQVEHALGKVKEEFEVTYLTEQFDLRRLSRTPAKFDREKLLSFNLRALQEMSVEAFTARLHEHAARYHPEFLEKLSPDQFALVAASNQARSKTLEDPIRSCMFFIVPDEALVYEVTKAARKAIENGDPPGYVHLENLLPVFESLDDWSLEGLERTLRAYADEFAGGKLGKVGQPIRVAVTGGTMSPGIFETLAILGKQSVINRIRQCLARRNEAQSTRS